MSRESPPDEAIAAAADVVDVLHQFGLSDEEIVDGAIEAPDSIPDATNAVASHGTQSGDSDPTAVHDPRKRGRYRTCSAGAPGES
ncbi:hypothetical protein [Natrinema longum]|uniref:hypothetical protein n=1 Tax=Natrinema longum TaxID=370324 RepID=UPI001CC947B7|nr:hypothetical protein [Natrinema longum]